MSVLPGGMTLFFFFFNGSATTEIYTIAYALSLHGALPIGGGGGGGRGGGCLYEVCIVLRVRL